MDEIARYNQERWEELSRNRVEYTPLDTRMKK
jgi:hypothetical protein